MKKERINHKTGVRDQTMMKYFTIIFNAMEKLPRTEAKRIWLAIYELLDFGNK